jgi:hypothetical protein
VDLPHREAHLMEPPEIIDFAHALSILKSPEVRDFFGESEGLHRFPFGLWFRGHSTVVPDLEPRVFRDCLPPPSNNRKGLWDETNVYDHLKLRVPSHERTYHSAFDWLCLMQHYSLPTRLLDWSESILPALYFAVKDDEAESGELVLLNAKRLNVISKGRHTISTPDDAHVIVRAEMASTRSLKKYMRRPNVIKALDGDSSGRLQGDWIHNATQPIAVFPRRLNERMVFQSSVFTLHGGKRYDEERRKRYDEDDRMPEPVTLNQVDELADKPILMRYRIPAAVKHEILDDLFGIGVHEAVLFPEVDRQAPYLQRLWWYT